MKAKNLARTAIISGSCLFGTAFAEGPVDGKVYGQLNLNYGTTDNKVAKDAWRVSSANSRLGVKGGGKLKHDLEVVYQIELGIEADDGSSNHSKKTVNADGTESTDVDTVTVTQRNVFVGVKGAFGGFNMGKHDTPLKQAQGKFDLFNDLEGDIGKIMVGENRQSNQFWYESPSFGGVKLKASAMPGEQNGTKDEDGPADATSASLTFEKAGFYVGLAMDSDVKVRKQDVSRGVVTYKAHGLHVGLLYENAKRDDGSKYANGEDSADATGVSLAYKVMGLTIKAQYLASEQTVEEGTSTSVGLDYALSESTKTYVYNTSLSGKDDAAKTTVSAVGIVHKF